MDSNLPRISQRVIKLGRLLAVLTCWLHLSAPLPSQEEGPPAACNVPLETLTARLLQDLPSYTNRVIQRARRQGSSYNLTSYVIIAGKPEFEPLPLPQRQYAPLLPDTTRQIFFTTLERQYSQDRVVDRQNFHWLFLTQTPSGWRLALLYSQWAALPPDTPPLPPQEASNSALGQGIRLWLRDCRAGAI